MHQSCYVLVESAWGNAALSSVCAQGRDGVGHVADCPGRALVRSCVGGSRIKRRPRAGLPQAADRSRGGSSRAGKRPPHVAKAAHANSGSLRMPATAFEWPHSRSRVLAVAYAVAVCWRPHKRRRR
ncbi:hypothetical protein GW17_00050845 [Ensete ventricosum]|nr:hypothetical protein GW17_00050845 [Ensete ventricosum]